MLHLIGIARLLGCVLIFFPALLPEAGDPPAVEPSKVTASLKPLDAPGITNFFELSPLVFSGSTPEGEKGFATLAERGIKTIISVDGSKPQVELARTFGIRYIHLPHGYGGIDKKTQLQLLKAAEIPGRIYVHCHQGKHRGPAAAALICRGKMNWSPQQAQAYLAAAGTSTHYPGLYETVTLFEKPSERELALVEEDLPEVAQVAGLMGAMVLIDERWDNLNQIKRAEYRTPLNKPDLIPANEAVMLWEHFRESQRLPDVTSRGEDFLKRFKDAEVEAMELENSFRRFQLDPTQKNRVQVEKNFETVRKTCSTCHQTYRGSAERRAGGTIGLSAPDQ
jgi:uncharacterized protein YdaT